MDYPTEFPVAYSSFTVHFSFINGGGTPTGPFTIRLQLGNQYQPGSDIVTDVKAPSYPPRATDSVNYPFPNGLPAGSYFIYAYLDIFNQVKEASKTNNTIYRGFIVE